MESIKKVIVVCIIIYLISEIISAISLFILSKRDDKMGELSRKFIESVKTKMCQLYK
jgi:ABC-type transport system involved in multi-copper enzyme maturation permease subunit